MKKQRELLFSVTKKDLGIQTFRSGGKGGQHQNKTDSGVRIVHKASGATGESREHRSQYQNKRAAFKRMVGSSQFQGWIKVEVARLSMRRPVEELVDEAMKTCSLKIEVRDEFGRWVPG